MNIPDDHDKTQGQSSWIGTSTKKELAHNYGRLKLSNQLVL